MRIVPIGCAVTLLALPTTPLLGQPVSARVLIAAGEAGRDLSEVTRRLDPDPQHQPRPFRIVRPSLRIP